MSCKPTSCRPVTRQGLLCSPGQRLPICTDVQVKIPPTPHLLGAPRRVFSLGFMLEKMMKKWGTEVRTSMGLQILPIGFLSRGQKWSLGSRPGHESRLRIPAVWTLNFCRMIVPPSSGCCVAVYKYCINTSSQGICHVHLYMAVGRLICFSSSVHLCL